MTFFTNSVSAVASQKNLLINSREAAKLLSISERTLWGLKESGSLPYVRIGRSVRYGRADLETWIEEQKKRNVPGKRTPEAATPEVQNIKTASLNKKGRNV
jgi:excisionase family DNA binding protein